MNVTNSIKSHIKESITQFSHTQKKDAKTDTLSTLNNDIPEVIEYFQNQGYNLTKTELAGIRNFYSKAEGTKQEKLDSLKTAHTKGIELSEDKLEAVHIALSGTTVEEAKTLSRVFLELRSSGDEDYIKFKHLLARTLTNTTLKVMSKGMDLKLTVTEAVNYYAREAYTDHGFATFTRTGESLYIDKEYTGSFLDQMNNEQLTELVEKNAKGQTLTEEELSSVKESFNERYVKTLDNLLDSMDTYGFATLIGEAVLGADGEFSDPELVILGGLPKEIKDLKTSYDSFHQGVSDLSDALQNQFGDFDQNNHTEEAFKSTIPQRLTEKLHDYILNRDESSYFKSASENDLMNLKKSADSMEIAIKEQDYAAFTDELKSFKDTMSTMSKEPFSNSKYIESRFKGPYKVLSAKPNIYTRNAKHVLNLLESANIGVEYSDDPEVIRTQRRKWKTTEIDAPIGGTFYEDTVIMTARNSIDRDGNIKNYFYASRNTKESLGILRKHNKRIYGNGLLNIASSKFEFREFYMNMLNINSSDINILDIRFRQQEHVNILDFGNFQLDMKVYFSSYGIAWFNFHAFDYNMTLTVKSDNENLINFIKRDESRYEEQVQMMGFKNLTLQNEHIDVTIKSSTSSSSSSVFLEKNSHTTFEVSI